MTTTLVVQHRGQARLEAEKDSLQRQSEQMGRLCSSLRASLPQAAGDALSRLTETVRIDCGKDCGPLTHCGSGFLYGFSSDGSKPAESATAPLNIRLHRTRMEHTLAQAPRMKAAGIEQQVVLSDAWGYEGEYPGDHGDWAKWEQFLRRQMDLLRQADVRAQLDIWNEPDHGRFWKRSDEQFLETWTRAFRVLRQTDPSAVIVGPSWSNVRPGDRRFDDFLLHCLTNAVVPDYITWHFPKDAVAEAQACRQLCARAGIHVRGIMINEYCASNEQTAANTAWHLAQLERARVDAACHAIWADLDRHENLDGVLGEGGGPRGQWWVYRRYAEMDGRLLGSTPGTNVEVVAAASLAARRLDILLGRRGGAGLRVVVRLENLEALPFLAGGQPVQITVEQVPENGGAVVTQLPVLLRGTAGRPRGDVEFLLPWLEADDAYTVRVSPGPANLAAK